MLLLFIPDQLRSRLREYGLITPISTDSHGHFLSHLLSANHKQRVKREVGAEGSEQASDRLFFNITVFGREFHLRLRPNDRLVSPGAMVEWHDQVPEPGNASSSSTITSNSGSRGTIRVGGENGSESTSGGTERILRRRLLKTDCTFIGDITDVKGASVAINNCDGLVNSRQPLMQTHTHTAPSTLSTL